MNITLDISLDFQQAAAELLDTAESLKAVAKAIESVEKNTDEPISIVIDPNRDKSK